MFDCLQNCASVGFWFGVLCFGFFFLKYQSLCLPVVDADPVT